jgi:hypothetical protein
MSTQQAASMLASKFSGNVSNVQNTDLYGVLVQDGQHVTEEVKLVAQQLAERFGNVAAVTVPWSSGRRFVGFSSNPEEQRASLADQGKTMERLDLVRPYGNGALYGGAWTCVGDDCLTPYGTRK